MSIRSATRDGLGLGVRYRAAYRCSARRIDAGSVLRSAVPSMVDHLRPSTWQTATLGSAEACTAFSERLDVMTHAHRHSRSSVTPTGVTWGRPSARNVVRVHRCRSVQKPRSDAGKSPQSGFHEAT